MSVRECLSVCLSVQIRLTDTKASGDSPVSAFPLTRDALGL